MDRVRRYRDSLRFTLSQPGVASAIVGTTNVSHIQGNIDAVSKGALPEDLVTRIREAFRRAESAAGETWPGLR